MWRVSSDPRYISTGDFTGSPSGSYVVGCHPLTIDECIQAKEGVWLVQETPTWAPFQREHRCSFCLEAESFPGQKAPTVCQALEEEGVANNMVPTGGGP